MTIREFIWEEAIPSLVTVAYSAQPAENTYRSSTLCIRHTISKWVQSSWSMEFEPSCLTSQVQFLHARPEKFSIVKNTAGFWKSAFLDFRKYIQNKARKQSLSGHEPTSLMLKSWLTLWSEFKISIYFPTTAIKVIGVSRETWTIDVRHTGSLFNLWQKKGWQMIFCTKCLDNYKRKVLQTILFIAAK